MSIARNLITVAPATAPRDLLVANLTGADLTVWSQLMNVSATPGPLLAEVTLGYSPNAGTNFVRASHCIATPAGSHTGPVIVWHESGRTDLTCVDVDSGSAVSIDLAPTGRTASSVYPDVAIYDDAGTLVLLYEYEDSVDGRCMVIARATTDGVTVTYARRALDTSGDAIGYAAGKILGDGIAYYQDKTSGGLGNLVSSSTTVLSWSEIEPLGDVNNAPDVVEGMPLGARGPVYSWTSGDLRWSIGHARNMSSGEDLPPFVGMGLSVAGPLYDDALFADEGAQDIGGLLPGSKWDFAYLTPDASFGQPLSGNPTRGFDGWLVWPLSIVMGIKYAHSITLGTGASQQAPVLDKTVTGVGTFAATAVWAWEH